MNNNFFFPSKRSSIDNFKVMQLLSDANLLEKKGMDIYHLELGEPQSKTPLKVKNEVKKLLKLNLPGYTPSNGIIELRKSISDFYNVKYNLKVPKDNIFITTGSSGAFLLSFLVCFDPGQKIGIFSPVYPAYRNILKSLNLKVIEINPLKNKIENLNINGLKDIEGLSGLIISNPNNPNGQVLSNKELSFIYSYCQKNRIILISDEIYHGIEYRKKTKSILNYGSKAVVINSFSKYFCMPGWRLGWAVVPDQFIDNFLKLSQNLFISSGNLAQYSAIKVFECLDDLDLVVDNYLENRGIVFDSLKKIEKIKFSKPNGAFYFYLNISKIHSCSNSFVSKLLKETGIAITPGLDFDKKNGLKTIRIAFSAKKQKVNKAMKIFEKWIYNNY